MLARADAVLGLLPLLNPWPFRKMHQVQTQPNLHHHLDVDVDVDADADVDVDVATSILYPSITSSKEILCVPISINCRNAKTSNGRLPHEDGSDRRETLGKRVSDDLQFSIFRRQEVFGKKFGLGNPFFINFGRFLRCYSFFDVKI